MYTQIRVERGVQYLWRRVPSTASCIISTESEPPSKMTDLTIQNIEIEREGAGGEISMTFDMLWSPPSTANGALTQYELVISTLTAADSTSILSQSTYTVSVYPMYYYQSTYTVSVYPMYYISQHIQ